MIKVKENLTAEQVKQFSTETREFGIGRNIRRGIANTLKRGKDYLQNKEGKYKAGVVYLKATKGKSSITYSLDDMSTSPCSSPKEANDKIPEVVDKILAKNDKNSASDYNEGVFTFCYPVIAMKAVAAEAYEDEIKEEMEDARESNDWLKLMHPKIKTLKGKMKL